MKRNISISQKRTANLREIGCEFIKSNVWIIGGPTIEVLLYIPVNYTTS